MNESTNKIFSATATPLASIFGGADRYGPYSGGMYLCSKTRGWFE